jgi:uncharacterized protein (UPF0332 family)
MTPKQSQQFNRMRAVLLLIAKEYMTVGQIRRNAEKCYGMTFEESLTAAYENMKSEAAAAVRGVAAISDQKAIPPQPMPPRNVELREDQPSC